MEPQDKQTIYGVPLHLMSSIRDKAEEASAEEGVTLNEFVNVTIAETLAHREWLKRKKAPTEESIAEALRILNSPRDGRRRETFSGSMSR